MTRARVWYVWVVLGVTIPVAAGWLLTFAGFRVIEAAPLLFGAGMAFSWTTPTLIRAIYRCIW